MLSFTIKGVVIMIKQHHMRPSKTPKRLLTVACSAAIAAGFNSLPTFAQNELALEEVIVSATRRDESIQDVAVSVAAITRELGQAQVRRLEDLQTFSPSTYIRRYPGAGSAAFINIRGVGTTDYDKSLDPPIGVIMDGLFLGTASGVLMQNFDIERSEILRGPQGTLFGKNTIGGVINVSTKRPSGEFGVQAKARVGNEGLLQAIRDKTAESTKDHATHHARRDGLPFFVRVDYPETVGVQRRLTLRLFRKMRRRNYTKTAD